MAYTTNKTLLQRVKDADEVSWEEFYRTYSRLIWVCGGDFHFSEDERIELIQMVMIEVFKSQATFQYDRSKGRFRNYLKKIILHQALRLRKSRMTLCAADQPEEPDDDGFEKDWQEEWETHVLNEAMELLRQRMEPLTLQIFELYAIQGRDAGEVAKMLGVNINMVYIAKSRGTAILRQTITMLDEYR